MAKWAARGEQRSPRTITAGRLESVSTGVGHVQSSVFRHDQRERVSLYGAAVVPGVREPALQPGHPAGGGVLLGRRTARDVVRARTGQRADRTALLEPGWCHLVRVGWIVVRIDLLVCRPHAFPGLAAA